MSFWDRTLFWDTFLQGGSIVALYESESTMTYQKCNYFEEDGLIYLNFLRNFLIPVSPIRF